MRDVQFIGTSHEDLRAFPLRARRTAGTALRFAQQGERPASAKPLQGFGGAGVQEIVANDPLGTFRLVYVVNLPDAVYVLHAFQKKSTHGIKTSARDLEIIRARLREAQRRSAAARRSSTEETS